MNFAFSEEQEELRRAVRQFLEAKSPRDRGAPADGDDRGLRPRGLEADGATSSGCRASHIPEEYGGQGFTFVELGIVLEERAGRCCARRTSRRSCLAANAILNAGTDDEKKALLPGIARGETIATLAFTEPNGKWDADGITMEAEPSRATATRSNGDEDVRARRPHRRPDRRRGPHRGHEAARTASRSSPSPATPPGLTRTAARRRWTRPASRPSSSSRTCRPRRSARPAPAGPRCRRRSTRPRSASSNEMVGGAQFVLEMSVAVRQGPRAVRPPDRLVPGHQAQVRRHAARGRVGEVGGVLRGVGRGRGQRRAAGGRRAWPRPTARTRTSTPPPRTSRSTAASASPGSTTRTCTSSAPSPPRSSSATPTYHRELLAQRIGI